MKPSRIKVIKRAMEMAAAYLTGKSAYEARYYCGRLLGLTDAQSSTLAGGSNK